MKTTTCVGAGLIGLAFMTALPGCASVETAVAEQGNGVSLNLEADEQKVWSVIPDTLGALSLNLVHADRASHLVTADAGVSGFSWGERVAIFVKPLDAGHTRVEVVSKRALATNITATDWSSPILNQIAIRLRYPEGIVQAFTEFQKKPQPRAFVIASDNHYTWAHGKSPQDKALGNCQSRGWQDCRVLAVDAALVKD